MQDIVGQILFARNQMQKDKYKSIEMFEIKKLISKGTFGKVFKIYYAKIEINLSY